MTREIQGNALYEFLMTDGHRIPTTLRSNPLNIQSAVQHMRVTIKCTRKNDKGKDIDDIALVTYDGHVCPDVKSPKRIFAFARDSNAARNGVTSGYDQDDRILADNAVKVGRIAKKLNLPCVFNEDGSTVDEEVIYNADPIKLRNVIRVVGCILNCD